VPPVQNAAMPILAEFAAIVAGVLHVAFFVLESVLFDRPSVWRRFGVRSAQDAVVIQPMAFNQGFYNLFLSVGIALGLVLVATGNEVAGRAVVVFACASMVAAGAVLVTTDRRFAPAAAIQALPPLVALLATLAR
jgi:putative membrane protein